jgi:hypothetical protein
MKKSPKKTTKKRSAQLEIRQRVPLDQAGLWVRAYNRQGEFLGRIEVNNAGVAAYVGSRGTKRLGNLAWEWFFERMAKNKRGKQ